MSKQQTKKLICVILVFSWFNCGNAQPIVSPAVESKPQIIAVFPERFPPIYSITVNNLPTGFGIDVMEEVASAAGLKVKYVPVSTWEEAFDRLKNGSADVIPNLGITARRKKFSAFTRPINKIPVSLLVLEDKKVFSKLSDLRNSRYIVGVIKNNVGVTILKSEPTIRSKVYPHLADALLDMVTNKIDAVIYPVPVAEYLARNLRLNGNLKAIGEPLAEIPRAIATSKTNPVLLKQLDDALAVLLQSNTYSMIYKRWHPEPAFWNHQRVASLVALFLIIGLLAYTYFRFSVLRRVNNELSSSNTFIKTVLDITAEGVLTLDCNGIIGSVNKAAEKIFNRQEGSLLGCSVKSLMPDVEAKEFIKSLLMFNGDARRDAGMHAEDRFKEYLIKADDGRLFPVRIALETATVNKARYFICTIQDVSQLREAQGLADFYINHDPLTGLVNQNGFAVLLKSLLSQAKRYKRPLSCLHVDIDRMHAINNAYGHVVGDQVLIRFSKCLDNIIRESDILGVYDDNLLMRVGGNRFVIVLPETDLSGASEVAKRIVQTIEKQSFRIKKHKINVTCKIGLACYPEHGVTPFDLLSHSEAALRIAKVDVRRPVHVYQESENNEEKNTDAWVEKITAGIREDRFFLLFQPILDIASGKVHHFEALVRYQDENNRIISPNEFIPVAERYGSIKQLDRRVMQLAISHLAGLEAIGEDVSIGINLSGANIGDPELFAWLEMLFEENELDPSHLVFEITETASLFSISAARSFIDSIKALGCRIALDDFGTGLSSFSYLRNFPVDILKIDGSFIRNLPQSHEDRVMVRSMVDVAHSLGKQVVAEFVSSKEIFDIVQAFGVDYAQGYYISQPVSLLEFMRTSEYFRN